MCAEGAGHRHTPAPEGDFTSLLFSPGSRQALWAQERGRTRVTQLRESEVLHGSAQLTQQDQRSTPAEVQGAPVSLPTAVGPGSISDTEGSPLTRGELPQL